MTLSILITKKVFLADVAKIKDLENDYLLNG